MKYVLALGIMFVLLIGAIGLWIFQSQPQKRPTVEHTVTFSSGATAIIRVEQGVTTSPEVESAFVSHIDNADQIIIGSTVIASEYALQSWSDENKAGEALLKRNEKGDWELLSMGGGAWDVDSLVAGGVPRAVAQQLTAQK